MTRSLTNSRPTSRDKALLVKKISIACSQVGPMEEDSEILRYAQELSREVRPGRSEPEEVTWDDGLPLDRVIVRYGEVKLPRAMRGRLTPRDWRPLIASSLIYGRFLYVGLRRDLMVRLALPVAVGEIFLAYTILQIFQMGSSQADFELTIVVVAWSLYASTLLTLYVHWLWRRQFYEADKRAAEIVETATLTESLRKNRDASSELKGSTRRFSVLPSIDQRLRKLEKSLRP